jgi:predicted RNA-binding protein with PIN domain
MQKLTFWNKMYAASKEISSQQSVYYTNNKQTTDTSNEKRLTAITNSNGYLYTRTGD